MMACMQWSHCADRVGCGLLNPLISSLSFWIAREGGLEMFNSAAAFEKFSVSAKLRKYLTYDRFMA
jgi:hypothetical protein